MGDVPKLDSNRSSHLDLCVLALLRDQSLEGDEGSCRGQRTGRAHRGHLLASVARNSTFLTFWLCCSYFSTTSVASQELTGHCVLFTYNTVEHCWRSGVPSSGPTLPRRLASFQLSARVSSCLSLSDFSFLAGDGAGVPSFVAGNLFPRLGILAECLRVSPKTPSCSHLVTEKVLTVPLTLASNHA
jgi:hypothetical protein